LFTQFCHIYRNVPMLLRRTREEAGMTQSDLAKQIGESQP
jgi:DNA-binding XRE family transcriptional regulator